jgi:hypothetical protein
MTLLHDDSRPDAEAGVRTMLVRLAAHTSTCPPAWEDLIERDEADVLPLRLSGSIAQTAVRRRRSDRRPRTTRAAAAVLVLAAAGALVVGRAGSGPTDRPSAQTISAISPGDPAFDAGAAPAVWATRQADPAAATLDYLAAMGVPTGVTPPAVALRGTAGTTAVVDWSLAAVAGGSRGTVYLRSSSTAGTPPTWTVVGSAASDIALSEVRYDRSRLSFTVTRTAAGPEQVAVGAWIDGQPVSLGREPIAWAGSGAVSLGELIDLRTGIGAHDTLSLPADADDIVTLRVVRVVDGTVRSLTQMAVALPDAAPALAASGAPALDAGGHATSQANTGVDGGSGTAGAGGDAGGSGGIDTAPLGTAPAVPELPPLPVPLPTLPVSGAPAPTVPTIPTVPGVPAPTLPTPPTPGLG